MKPNAKFVVQTYSRLLNWTSLPLSLSLKLVPRTSFLFPSKQILGSRLSKIVLFQLTGKGELLGRLEFSPRKLKVASVMYCYNPGQNFLGDLPFFTCFCMEFAANRQYTLKNTALTGFIPTAPAPPPNKVGVLNLCKIGKR